ncbi:MOSC domain-containing protein [Pontibacter qinzhouensis]|uniref:MOSC domain-containing protein n=1 Tax=Pontibacter qinzhouensis TaxID=2603253 RepID=A0A5C8KA73_9BACT|nr:MOSC N-terminal beta barrel domain-containing protein [Pontibacter qinzhouensis]TXK46441.1 MOSC domain-containing protein [Pontibacter qinzhouensis]
MTTFKITGITIYPIKSLGGVSLQQAQVEERGFRHDRRWMLIDADNNFLTQRQHAQMALLQVRLLQNGLEVNHKNGLLQPLLVPFGQTEGPELQVRIWDDTCTALEVSAAVSAWFTGALQMPARLVYMPAASERKVDPNYAQQNEIVGFADGYPFLLIGQASLDDLNSRLPEPVPMNRFRPNLVFTGSAPFAEDSFLRFRIGETHFRVAKPCARCVVTTIDQASATKSPEPLKTLATYRVQNKKVMFGQNLVHEGRGEIRVGDELVVEEWQ